MAGLKYGPVGLDGVLLCIISRGKRREISRGFSQREKNPPTTLRHLAVLYQGRQTRENKENFLQEIMTYADGSEF